MLRKNVSINTYSISENSVRSERSGAAAFQADSVEEQ